ncbi:MAG: type III pantothenate kinase [candidate division KSB1 bacterium]|nr:type III pantothenate kinase [candidate division KSB1 bacterium]
MLLVADIGNTNITFGLFEQAKIRAQWRLASGATRTEDEIWILIKMLLESEGFVLNQVQGFSLSSVVPNLTPVFERVVAKRLKVPMVNVTADLDTGITILYENPHQVGADRICNAVAGFAKYGGPLVVVDFGTGTTFDVVTANAEYLGGIIAPGPETTALVLHRVAAKLPKVELRFPPSLIGRTTETSIQSGLMYGGVEMIEGINRRLKEALGAKTKFVATGGLAQVFMPHLKSVDGVEPSLTLDGLRMLFERCAPRG